MLCCRIALAVLLVFPGLAVAQKKQIQELQRDMALLQDQLRATNEKLASVAMLVEQVLDRVNNTNTAMAVLEKSVKESLREQEKSMVAPMATVGTKVDSMAGEFRSVRESVSDLGQRVGRIQTQLDDLKMSVQVLAAPPPPPAVGEAAAGAAPVTPTASAASLFNNARRDQSGGQLDLALAQYEDFLKSFPDSDLAPVAQYNIGEIYYNKREYDQARRAFDLVLEKYPENSKTADAMYMKAMSLVRAGDRASASQELRALLKKYPSGEIAEKAQGQLKQLGGGR
jgi:tol-pal system protein YbgF